MPRTTIKMGPTIGFRLPLEVHSLLQAEARNGESLGDVSRRLLTEALTSDTRKRVKAPTNPHPQTLDNTKEPHEHTKHHTTPGGFPVCHCGWTQGRDNTWRP